MSEFSKKTLLNVPNLLTYSRIAVIPIVMLCLIKQGPTHSYHYNLTLSWVGAIFFILAGISDLVDGHYARKYGQVSLMGKFIDPIADKLIHMAVMLILIEMARLPAWLVVIHLFREFVVSGLRTVAIGEGVVIAAGSSGKKKTAWLNVSLSGFIIWYDIFGISTYSIAWVAMGVATVYSLYSGVEYFYLFVQGVRKKS